MAHIPDALQRLVRRDELDPFSQTEIRTPCFPFEEKPPLRKGRDLGIAIVGAGFVVHLGHLPAYRKGGFRVLHTARWMSQICDQWRDVHLFPSLDVGFSHTDLMNCTVHHSLFSKQRKASGSVRFRGVPVIHETVAYLGRGFLRKYFPNYRVGQLVRAIKRLKPDVIHAMEMQAAGYLTVAAKERMKGELPPSIITSWGSDLYLFGRLKEHETQIRRVLSEFDYYSCECQRDVILAKAYSLSVSCFPFAMFLINYFNLIGKTRF